MCLMDQRGQLSHETPILYEWISFITCCYDKDTIKLILNMLTCIVGIVKSPKRHKLPALRLRRLMENVESLMVKTKKTKVSVIS